MKTFPQNIAPSFFEASRHYKLDQSMMRKLRKLADRTCWTVEDLIHEGVVEFVAKCEAERELEMKIMRFPTQCL